MAERRMLSKSIIDSDNFLELSLSSQLLYFHLAMRADDDGFVNSPKKIMKMLDIKDTELNSLISNHFVILFNSGIIVITHWKIHNYIPKDRYKKTVYNEEKSMLELSEKGEYRLIDNVSYTDCIQDVYGMDTQDRLGKDRLGKVNKKEIYKEKADTKNSASLSKVQKHKYGSYNNVLLSDDDMEKLKAEFPTDYQERIEKLSEYMASTGKSYKNHLATVRVWAKKDNPQNNNQPNYSDSSRYKNITMDI